MRLDAERAEHTRWRTFVLQAVRSARRRMVLCHALVCTKGDSPIFLCFGRIVAAEKHRYAPYSRKTDNRINYPRKNCHLTAEYRTDEIVTEKADKQPVDCAYNNQTK
jgi:hypothetical protein